MIDAGCLIPISLLLLRIIIAIVFFSSGKSHVAHSVERGKSVGLSPAVRLYSEKNICMETGFYEDRGYGNRKHFQYLPYKCFNEYAAE